MGRLEVVAPDELVEKITAQWKFSEGLVFDLAYPEKFRETTASCFQRVFRQITFSTCATAAI
jgi:hypothetical protein